MDKNITPDYIPGLVSVVMPAYNASAYIKEAIESILFQTYSNLEFLIINDGSSDNTLEIIKSFTDSRIRVINNTQNRGLIYCLNHGISSSRGEYIARMDSDDIAYKNRLELQVDFLEHHAAYGLVGCGRQLFGENLKKRNQMFPSTNSEIIGYSYLANPVIHPTFLFRKTICTSYGITYNPEFMHLEDYKFVIDCINNGIKIHNIPHILLKYRISPTQVTSINFNNQLEKNRKLRTEWISLFCMKHSIYYSNDHISLIANLIKYRPASITDRISLSNILFSLLLSIDITQLSSRLKLSTLFRLGWKNCLRLLLHCMKLKDYSPIKLK